MKNFLALSLIFSSAALFAANVTNLPPIADKPWVTNTIRTSSALATNTPAAGYVLTSDGSTNYWKVNIASSTNVFNDSFASYGSVAHVWYDAPLHTVTLGAWTTFSNFNYHYSTNIYVNTNTGRIIVTNAGDYYFCFSVEFQASTTLFYTRFALFTNDAVYSNFQSIVRANVAGIVPSYATTLQGIYTAPAGAVLDVRTYGGQNGYSLSNYHTSFTIYRLR